MSRDELTGESGKVEEWRQILASGDSFDAEICPQAGRFVSAVRGELDAAELEGLVVHAADCSACTVAWRIARLAREQELAASGSTFLRGPWQRAAAAVAALAALLVLVVGVDWQPGMQDVKPPVERNLEQIELESKVPQEALPREAFLLEWSAPEDGLRYDLTISTEDLTQLDRVEDWLMTEYQVPEDRLAGLPAGTRILWKVETQLQSGKSIYKTFVNRLE